MKTLGWDHDEDQADGNNDDHEFRGEFIISILAPKRTRSFESMSADIATYSNPTINEADSKKSTLLTKYYGA